MGSAPWWTRTRLLLRWVLSRVDAVSITTQRRRDRSVERRNDGCSENTDTPTTGRGCGGVLVLRVTRHSVNEKTKHTKMGDALWAWAENVESTEFVVRVADNAAVAKACARGTIALSKVMGGVHIGVVGGGATQEAVLTKEIKSVAVAQGVSVTEYPGCLRLNQVCNVRMVRGMPRGRLPEVMVVALADGGERERSAVEDLCARAKNQRCLVMVVSKDATSSSVDLRTTPESGWGTVF